MPDALVLAGVGRLVATLAVCATGAALLGMSPGIGFDASPGLLASEQRLLGRGNRLTEILVANPDDLRRDIVMPVAWWPPGGQFVVHGLRASGLTLDQSIHAIAFVAWAVGLAGWAMCYRLTMVNRSLLPWMIAMVALLRLTHEEGFRFTGGGAVLWGAFPLVVLLHLIAAGRHSWGSLLWVSVAGCLAATLIVFKYSAAFLTVGLGAAWFWGVWRDKDGAMRWLAWLAGLIAGIGLAVLADVPQLLLGPNPLTSPRSHDVFSVITWGVFGPFEAMSDLTEVATTVSKRLGGGPLAERTTGLIALGLGILVLAWFVAATKSGMREPEAGSTVRSQALRIAGCVTVATCLALVALRLANGNVSWEARHHQYSMYLLLPFFAEWLVAACRRRGRLLRSVSVICLVIFFVVPATYGGLVLARRTLQGPTGIDREWSRQGAGASPPLADFTRGPGFEGALVATVSPRTALTFAEHRVLFVMEHESGEVAMSPDASWRTRRFFGRPAGGIAVVLPPGVTAGDRDTLLRSFADVAEWTPVRLDGAPGAQLWMGR